MKKFFVGIAATVLAAAMCVSFAACGGTSADKAKSIKGEQVTEEQWDAAFQALEKDDAKFTIKMASTYEMTFEVDLTEVGGKKTSGTLTQSATVTYVNNATKQSEKGEINISSKGDFSFADLLENLGIPADQVKEGKTEMEMYTEKEGEGYTSYQKDKDGNWYKGKAYDSLLPLYDFNEDGRFTEYKYDETLQGYVDKDHTEDSHDYIVYKFNKDGQLVAAYSYSSKGSTDAMKQINEMSYIIEYSAKDITLPTVA